MKGMSQRTAKSQIDWLVLVPTPFEYERFQPFWAASVSDCKVNPFASADVSVHFEIVGFGPIVAAARTVQLISQCNPRQVLLTGIAGTYADKLPIGQAAVFSSVSCYGIGAGSGSLFQTVGQMGWSQWAGDASQPAISERIELRSESAAPDRAGLHTAPYDLLTVMSAAGTEQDAVDRLAFFPSAVAEDMEGFGVAAACQLCNVPLTIVRGISNRAGQRDKNNWSIDPALESAAILTSKWIAAQT